MRVRFKQGNSRRRGKRIDPASRVPREFLLGKNRLSKDDDSHGRPNRPTRLTFAPFLPLPLSLLPLLPSQSPPRKVFPRMDSSTKLGKTHHLLSDIDYTTLRFRERPWMHNGSRDR